jgi:hypothetical protein
LALGSPLMSAHEVRVLACAALLLCGLEANAAFSAAGECAQISNHDLRWLCRAEVENREASCASISNADLRWHCRAVVTGKPSYGASIRDGNRRALCRARATR